MGIPRTTGSRATLAALLLIAIVGGVLAVVACGGSAETTSSSPSATPRPPVAASPERLVGSDSVAQTKEAVEAYTAAWNARSVNRLDAVYANDIVFHCFATGAEAEGRAAMLQLLKQVCAVTVGARALAGHVSNGWAVLELRQDFAPGSVQLLQVLETRDGKISRHENYYQPLESQVGPLRIAKPLKTAPGPADTPEASEAVALKYAAALQARDANAVLALVAADNDFRDTAGDSSSSTSELQHYASIFKASDASAFTDLRYVFGRGWATVIWTASAAGSGGSGATMLEIRDGKICRETLYYNSADVPFGTPGTTL